MDYFIQLFGDITVGTVITVVVAAVFLYGCYRKISSFFSEKTIREADKEREFKDVMHQVKKNQEWHQQNMNAQEEFNASIQKISDKLDSVNEELRSMKTGMEQEKATTSRYRILRFADEILHGMKHSKEHFDQILEDITEYENFCAEHKDYKNNKAVLAIESIKRTYQTCTEERTFL